MRKEIFKWIIGLLLAPIILFFMLAVMLYIPPIQDFAVKKTTVLLSDATGMKVGIGRLRLSVLFDIELQDVEVCNETEDCLLKLELFTVDLNFSSLLRGRIDVDGIELIQGSVATQSMIPGMEINGHIGRFFIDSHGISLPQSLITINNAILSEADVEVLLNDSTVEDTTTSAPLNWTIALRKVDLNQVRLLLSMPGDSMRIKGGIGNANLREGVIDLGQALYTVKSINLQADSLHYDLPYEQATEGLDINHITLRDIGLGIDSVRFDGNAMALDLSIRETRMKEKNGLEVQSLTGRFNMDSISIQVPTLELHTPHSSVSLQANMDFDALSQTPQGHLSAQISGEIGKQDILLFTGELPKSFVKAYPNAPIVLRLSADGNMNELRLNTAEAQLHPAFDFKADGIMRHLTDSALLAADLDWTLKTKNLDFIKTLAGPDTTGSLAIPPMFLNGKVKARGQNYTADLRIRESQGTVNVKAGFNALTTAYHAGVNIKDFPLNHFLPKDSLYNLSMTAEARGKGFDFLNRHTNLQAQAHLEKLQFGQLDFGGMNLNALLNKGKGEFAFRSDNPLLKMSSNIHTLLNRRHTDMTFSVDLRSIDLYALQVTPKPFKIGMCLHIDGNTNLQDTHALHGEVSDISLITKDSVFRPKDLYLNLLAHPDTTYADISAGDFKLYFDGGDGYENLLKKTDLFMALLNRQVQQRRLDQDSIRLFLPEMTVDVTSGHDNPISSYLATLGYKFNDFRLHLNANPRIGLNGGGYAYALRSGTVLLDTIQMHIYQDTTGIQMDAWVRNGPKNKQFVFDSKLNAFLHATGAGVNLVYTDEKGKKGVDLGFQADILENGMSVRFSQTNPIIAYRKFEINPDNYLFLGNDRKIEANIDMLADDGTAAKIYSTPNPEALQDLSMALHHVNLEELTSVIPYAPHITGFLQADAHLIQTPQDLSVVAEIAVNDMTFEGAPLGLVGLSAVYLPNEDGTHFIDTRISQNETEVAALSGSYKEEEGEGLIEADLDLIEFPLSMANGFIPDKIAALAGIANGCMKVSGSIEQPKVNGWLATQDMGITSAEYSLNLRLADDTIKVRQSHLTLDQLNVYSQGKNPLVFDGNINFADFENIWLDLRMNASNFELMNAKRTPQATVYGKVYVDAFARVSGSLDDIDVKGRLGVLGNTDVTYVLKDSPLTSEDRLSGLVTFVDFNDTIPTTVKEEVKPMNMSVTMQISIDQGAQVHCLLSPDKSKYIDLGGGGELTMNYTPQGDLTLSGRYTVLNGEMKYSLPVIPLKTFTLTPGSYVDFTGPVLNPTLNLAATERIRSTVTENDVPRTVTFEVGLAITQTLENMGLEFTISAPEDMTIQNQLATMSAEERGKVAVTMLATGMYLAGDNTTGGFSTTNALNALLQSEINNIAGKALGTLDLSVGMDQSTTAEGTERTDYSFRFAKRFWGNRVSIIIGGKVSTGENVENTGQSMIDNVSIEYRLDKSATRYVTLFYDKNYESLLEGEITEMGAGLVLRRKMTRLGELFIFKNKKKKQPVTEKKP